MRQILEELFKNLFGNSPNKSITKIVNSQIEQFLEEEFDVVLKKLKAEKLQASTKNLQKYETQRHLKTYVFDFAKPNIYKIQ